MKDREQLAFFDAAGQRLGTKSRAEVHRDGDWHWLVFVWAARADEASRIQVLLQIRSRPGDPYLGSVDAPAGGHVLAAESPVQGAQREFAEEVGIALAEKDLVYLGEGKLENPTGVCQRVIEHFYLCQRPVLLAETCFSDEAGGFVEVELEAFLELVEGRRERVSGLGRFAGQQEIHEVELTRQALAAYQDAMLEDFRRGLRGIRDHLQKASGR
ncbi:MAG: NUDIX domain-containing protein [Candidatus Latescibacteria bacterium]|nr:NUDIX domain-containing protein [Candidatus Latescibacterota bacterium]